MIFIHRLITADDINIWNWLERCKQKLAFDYIQIVILSRTIWTFSNEKTGSENNKIFSCLLNDFYWKQYSELFQSSHKNRSSYSITFPILIGPISHYNRVKKIIEFPKKSIPIWKVPIEKINRRQSNYWKFCCFSPQKNKIIEFFLNTLKILLLQY